MKKPIAIPEMHGFKPDKNFIQPANNTICVMKVNGYVFEVHGIKEPYKYMAKIKKRVDVKNAWIKNK